MKSKKVYFVRFAAAFAVAVLAGCAMVKKDEDPAVLKEKSVQRWDLLIAHQAEKAYDFLSPGYRQTKDRASYAKEMTARPVRWSKVHYSSQECESDVCKVHLTVDYSINMGGPAGVVKSSSFIVETWVKSEGKWWYLPSQLGPTKPGKDKDS